MRASQLLRDEDAVSPVIGVILMVAITVILAAVIGTFVLGIGGSQENAPKASFDFNYDQSKQTLTIVHQSGDSFTTENTAALNIRGPLASGSVTWGVPVSSGDSKTLSVTSSGEVRIIWEGNSGKKSTVATFNADT